LRGAADGSFELEFTCIRGVGVGPGGLCLKADVPLLGRGQPEGEVGVGEGVGHLFVAELEVDAGAGGFYVGEARGGAGLALVGGGGVGVRGLHEDVLQVPAALGVAHDVETGAGAVFVDLEADGGDLDLTTPERADAEGGFDLVGLDDGLAAEGGRLADDEVFEGEAGYGKDVEGDAVEMDGAAEALAHVGGDAVPEALDAEERRRDDEGDEEEDDESGEDEPAARAGRGVVEGLVLGCEVHEVRGLVYAEGKKEIGRRK